MASVAALLSAIASVLWPVIAIAVFIIFRPTLMEVLGSAKSRKFTLKIGGQELSMDEANEQQRSLILDLQSKVVQIESRIEATIPKNVATAEIRSEARSLSKVLWVDDQPKNNSYFVDSLNRLNIQVDLAETTADGLIKFSAGRYDAMISDMGRREGGRYNDRAGFELLKVVREQDATIPFIIFCSTRGARENRDEAMRLGASGITSSPTELYSLLKLPTVQ
jgi:CheY-like chemotaxis protein